MTLLEKIEKLSPADQKRVWAMVDAMLEENRRTAKQAPAAQASAV